jgi:transposase
MGERGRVKKIQAEQHVVLREIVAEKPLATLEEVGAEFTRRTGIRVHSATLTKGLREAGIERRRGPGNAIAEGPVSKAKRYGYTQAHRAKAPEQRYTSCLSDAEWSRVEDIFSNDGGRGLPPRYPRRLLLDACCYVVRTGCSWRLLPKDFPQWQNVYRSFRRWSEQGKFEQMHDRLRAQWREREGRAATPTAAVLDAQSTRHSPQGGTSGYDAGKKIKGRKRHLVTDTLGLVLAVSVSAASVQDRDGAHPVMASTMAKYPTVETIFVDSAYAGQCAQTIHQKHGINVDVVRHPANSNVGRWCLPEQADLFMRQADANGFTVLPKRWVVERTHAWNERARRLIMHHDRRTDVSEAWVWLAEARLLARRLTTTV